MLFKKILFLKETFRSRSRKSVIISAPAPAKKGGSGSATLLLVFFDVSQVSRENTFEVKQRSSFIENIQNRNTLKKLDKTNFLGSVIVYVDPPDLVDAALEKAITEICTLGNWIYEQDNERPKFRCYLTNFVSSQLMQLYSLAFFRSSSMSNFFTDNDIASEVCQVFYYDMGSHHGHYPVQKFVFDILFSFFQ